MKHYTSRELIKLMDEKLGYWYDDDSSYRGYIVFRATIDGWSVFPLSFSTWREVAEWYREELENL